MRTDMAGDEIRELLRLIADEVPRENLVPPGAIGRARKRLIRNSVILVVVLTVAAFGTLSGVQALRDAGRTTPAVNPHVNFSDLVWSRVSPDEATFGGAAAISAVTAGGPGFVAVGGGDAFPGANSGLLVWTSPDGVSWTRLAPLLGGDAGSLTGVTPGGPGLVAVGYAHALGGDVPTVWTSVDGTTWTQAQGDGSVFAPDSLIFSVTTGGPGLVAVGVDRNPPDYTAAVWTSTDGLTWQRVPDDGAFGGPGNQGMRSVTSGPDGLVAVGWDESDSAKSVPTAAVWTSPNGVTWTRELGGGQALVSPDGAGMLSVTAGGPGYVAAGSVDEYSGSTDAAVWTSPDGVTWTRVPDDGSVFGGPQKQEIFSVRPVPGGLVAVGADGNETAAAVWTSPDGTTWTRVPNNGGVFGDSGKPLNVDLWLQAEDVVGADSGLIVVGWDSVDDQAAVWRTTPASSPSPASG
jgi:hypothetical protein